MQDATCGEIGSAQILGMRVAVVDRARVRDRVSAWADEKGQGHYICVANVHMCMECFDDAAFSSIVNGSDLTVPDGLPLVWVQRLLGHRLAQQVRGEDLTDDVCAMAERRKLAVGFFGATEELLAGLTGVLLQRYPNLNIAYCHAPPFRLLTNEENSRYAEEINAAGVKVLFVGLGCPKQERWMAMQRAHVAAVMLGVGAAFDFISGSKKPAPQWMRKVGLEWLFRLGSEPRRLWKRYLRHNPRFVWYACRQVLSRRQHRQV